MRINNISSSDLSPGVVPLLDHYEGDAWLVVWLQLDTSLSYSCQLVLQYVGELTLTNLGERDVKTE